MAVLARAPASRASASSVETGTMRRPRAIASPCIVAMPTRSPVNDPGPAATASRSTSSMRIAGALERAHQLARQALPVRERRIAGCLGQHGVVANDGDAAGARRRVECQDQQSLSPPGRVLQMLYCRTLRRSPSAARIAPEGRMLPR